MWNPLRINQRENKMAERLPESELRTQITARVTFFLLIIWMLMVLGIFLLVFLVSSKKIVIDTSLYGILGGVFGTETTLLTGAVGYWMGTSAGAKTSGDALAESNKTNAAAIAAIATTTGTGSGGGTIPVQVVNTPADPVPTEAQPPATPPETPFMERPLP